MHVDFEKAFGKVPDRLNLLVNMEFSDFLDKRQFRVTVNGKFSSCNKWYTPYDMIHILGPLLFIINDLPGTHEDERTVLFKTISLDGIKPNTNPKTNPNPKLTLILTLFSCFMLFSSIVL